MAGYTRQSTASIINGENITAPPLNAEFNQLASAFDASTGHEHDGTTGNAPKIDLTTSITGYLPAEHGGFGGKNNYSASTNPTSTDDTGDGYAVGSIWYNVTDDRYWVCMYAVAGAAVWLENRFIDTNNDFAPFAHNTVDLGTSLKRFKDLFLSNNIDVDGAANIASTLYVGGTGTFAGNVLANSMDISTTLDVTGNLTVDGTSTLATVDIASGTIDSTTIGATTASSGAFTTLSATSGITGDLTGNVTGNVTGQITSTTGTSTFSTIDVNGGAIDGTTIGAASASSGAFTTVSASGGFTGDLTGDVTGDLTGDVEGNVTGDLTGNVTASTGASTFNNVTINGTVDFTSTRLQNISNPVQDTDAASKSYVDTAVSNLIDSAPDSLNTLNELAAAINDDASAYNTLNTAIGTKLPKAGGTMTGEIAMGNNKITGLASPSNGNDAVNKTYVTGLFGDTQSAATSATNAAASATAAASSATSASNLYDQFDDRYLGAKSSDPTVDNDGDALATGALYFDTANNVTKVYNGTEWQAASSSIEGILSRFYYTATAGQTAFSGADDNSATMVMDKAELTSVFMNGVRLHTDDYTISLGTDTVTLAAGAAAGDLIEIEVFGNFAGQSGADVAITGGSITGLSSFSTDQGTFDNRGIILNHQNNINQSYIGAASGGDIGTATRIRFKYDDDTTSEAPSNINFVVGGTETYRITSSGAEVLGLLTTESLNLEDNNPRIRLDDTDTSNNGEVTLDNTALRIEVDEDNAVLNSAIKFRVDADAKAIITDDGYLGVGTENPGKMLHLSGGNALLQNADSETALSIVANANVTDAGNKIAWFGASRYDDGEEMAAIKGLLKSNSGGPGNVQLGHLAFYTSGTEKMRILDGGNIGFGVENPLTFLHAQNSGNVNIRFETTTADTVQTQYKNSAQQWSVGTDNANQFFVYDSNNAHSAFTLTPLSEAVFNQNSKDMDFRVESDNNSHFLFVDAANGHLGVNNSAPEVTADIQRNSSTGFSNTADQRSQMALTIRNGSEASGRYVGMNLIAGGGAQSDWSINNVWQSNYVGKLAFKTRTGANSGDWRQILAMTAGNEVVFNEDSTDIDFRVESDGNTNMFKVDAGNNRAFFGSGGFTTGLVGMDYNLDTSADWYSDSKAVLMLKNSNTNGNVSLKMNNQGTNNSFLVHNTSGTAGFHIYDRTITGKRFSADSTETVINEDSKNLDFRVESDSNTHMLLVDAGNNYVGVNTNTNVSNSVLIVDGMIATRNTNRGGTGLVTKTQTLSRSYTMSTSATNVLEFDDFGNGGADITVFRADVSSPAGAEVIKLYIAFQGSGSNIVGASMVQDDKVQQGSIHGVTFSITENNNTATLSITGDDNGGETQSLTFHCVTYGNESHHIDVL